MEDQSLMADLRSKTGKSTRRVDELKQILKTLKCDVPCKASKADLLKMISDALVDYTPQEIDYVYDGSKCSKPRQLKDCDIENIVRMFKDDTDATVVTEKRNMCITQQEAEMLSQLGDINIVWGYEMAEPPKNCSKDYNHHKNFHSVVPESLRKHMQPIVEPIYHTTAASGGAMRYNIYREFWATECFKIADEAEKDALLSYLSCPHGKDKKKQSMIVNLFRKLATRPLAQCTLGMAMIVVQARCMFVALVGGGNGTHELHAALLQMAEETEESPAQSDSDIGEEY